MTHLGQGYCNEGYYAGWDNQGIASQEACNDVCLNDENCKFAAWNPGYTCSRYKDTTCNLNNDVNHVTYAKTIGGT